MVKAVDEVLWSWDGIHHYRLPEKHPHLKSLGDLLDALVGDDPGGILSLQSWTDRQLVTAMARACPPEDKNHPRDSVAASLLQVLTAPTFRGHFPALQRGAQCLRDDREDATALLTREREERVLSLLDEFESLVARGYPEEWAYKTAQCRSALV